MFSDILLTELLIKVVKDGRFVRDGGKSVETGRFCFEFGSKF